jgi:hypothetical protein
MTLLVWRRQIPPVQILHPHHTTATLTDSVTITRGAHNHTVQFANPSLLPLAPTSITIPISAFDGSPLPQNTMANLTLTQQDLLDLGRACWIPAYQLQ